MDERQGSQNQQTLCRMFARLSPPALNHPIWVSFSNQDAVPSLQAISAFQTYSQEWLAIQEIESALTGIILEAALQTMAGEKTAARASLAQATELAARYSRPKFLQWTYWSQAALAFQAGQMAEVISHLAKLQAFLSSDGQWLLANLIELVQRALEGENADLVVLRLASDWLDHWGYAPVR